MHPRDKVNLGTMHEDEIQSGFLSGGTLHESQQFCRAQWWSENALMLLGLRTRVKNIMLDIVTLISC